MHIDEIINLSGKEIYSFIVDFLDSLENLIKTHLVELKNNQIEPTKLILSGEMSEIPFVLNRMVKLYRTSDIQIMAPADQFKSVMCGSELYSIDPYLIQSRRIQETIGIRKLVKANRHELTTLVEKYETYAFNEAITETIFPVRCPQPIVKFELFEGTYDDRSVAAIIDVRIPRKYVQFPVEHNRIEVSFYFALPDWKVVAVHENSGEVCEVKVLFL